MVVEAQQRIGNLHLRALLGGILDAGLVFVGHLHFRIEVLGSQAQGKQNRGKDYILLFHTLRLRKFIKS